MLHIHIPVILHIGAGLFVTTVLIGAVAMVKPVHLAQLPFMRDIVFYLAAAYWTFCLLWNGGINIWNASGKAVCRRTIIWHIQLTINGLYLCGKLLTAIVYDDYLCGGVELVITCCNPSTLV